MQPEHIGGQIVQQPPDGWTMDYDAYLKLKRNIMKNHIINIIGAACVGAGAFAMLTISGNLATYGAVVMGIGIGYFMNEAIKKIK